MSNFIYQVNNVSYDYIIDKNRSNNALKDICLDIHKGEAVTVVGPSGCGKSTLLYLLSGLMMPKSGQILFENNPLTTINRKAVLILQDYGLFPWKSVADNIALGLIINKKENKLSKSEIYAKVDEILELLNIIEHRDKYPTQLSGGQKQRVAIGRALIMEPEVLLMDEPFAALDAVTKDNLKNLIQSICKKRNLTLLFVTHNIEEAVALGDRVVVFGQEPGVIKEVFSSDTENLTEQIYSALGIGGADDEK